MGRAVRGGQPPGTERQREREAHSEASASASERKARLKIDRAASSLQPGTKSRPSKRVWGIECIVIMMATTTLTRSQRSNDAVRFPGLSSSSMRVSSSFSSSQSSFTNSPVAVRPCEGNADFCDFAPDYPQNIVPDPRFQGASLIKGKIFHTGSLDSSVNDVDVTKRFNIGERKERACKVRHHLQLTLEGQYLVILIWVQKVRRDIIYPQKGRNSQGSYLFIVNQDTFRQAVEVKHHLCLFDIFVVIAGSVPLIFVIVVIAIIIIIINVVFSL